MSPFYPSKLSCCVDPQFEKHISASPRTSASYCGANNSLQNWTCGSLGAGVGAIRWDFGQLNPMTSHFWMVYTHPFMVILGMVSCVIVSDILTLFYVYLCSINIFHNLIWFPTFCHTLSHWVSARPCEDVGIHLDSSTLSFSVQRCRWSLMFPKSRKKQ